MSPTLTLRILTYRHQPVPPAPTVRFDAAGGLIGRAPDSALVLDDPGKYISRVHARVSLRDDAFVLEDLGSNPSVVNDRPLGKGGQAVLAHGDRVLIGDYLLQAVVETAPAAMPAAVAAVAAAQPEAVPDLLAGASLLDVAPGQAGIGHDDPLGLNLFAPAAPARAAESDHVSPELMAFSRVGQSSAPAASGNAFAIPDDYDPLADLFPPAAAQAAVTPPAIPAAAPAAAVPPPTAPIMPAPAPAPAPAPSSASAPASAPADTRRAAPPDATVFMPASAPPPASPPAAVPAPAAPAPAPVPAQTTPASDTDILKALLRGLGLPNLQLGRPPTEVAELVGAMLREATAGTIDVLMARALTKKESRIDMTMLAVRANNPLKFFPNAEGALTQMLTGAMAGYMPPLEAMAGAFDDLRAHELAVIAGMRAALGAVLQRFDPAAIESRLAVPSVMDKMLASNRKAKLWDGLVALYGEIARDADDDLQRLFGEKFSEAYEAQVARLRQARQHL